MITIAAAPQLYTTLNLAMFKVLSDRPTILQFKVTVYDVATGNVITIQKYATIPMVNLGTSFDLANLLSPFVLTSIVNTTNVLEQVDKIYKAYRINILEIYLNEAGEQINGDYIDTTAYNIFNARLSRLDFRNYNYQSFVAGYGVSARFLSNRPLVSNVYYGDKEFIYLMTVVDCIARVTYYRADGLVLSVRDTYISTANRAYRLELSPIEVVYSNSNPFSDEFTPPFGISGGVDKTGYYTLVLVDMGGLAISETRTYVVKSYKCLTERMQVFFVNNLSGLDSMSFTQPRQSTTSIKTLINSNKYQYNDAGDYVDFNNGVFNPERVAISSQQQNTFSMISDTLTDATAKYARGLIESEEVYLRLNDDNFLPIILETQEYSMSKRKYSVTNERLTITFKIDDINLNL